MLLYLGFDTGKLPFVCVLHVARRRSQSPRGERASQAKSRRVSKVETTEMKFRALLLLLVVAALVFSSYAKRTVSKKAEKKPVDDFDEEDEDEISIGSKSNNKAASSGVSKLQQLFSVLQPHAAITDKNFTKWIADRPREYHAVLLFTATAPAYQCAVCVATKQIFVSAAEIYRDQFDFLAGSADGKTDESLDIAKNRLAFFVLEADTARTSFTNMGLETVPRIYAIPPTNANSPKMRLQDYEIQIHSIVEGGAATLLKELKDITGVNVRAMTHPGPAMLLLGLAAVAFAVLAAAAAYDPKEALYWFRSPSLWACVTTLCFCIGVSGSIFCIIRSPPLYGTPYGSKGLKIFADQGQQQYLIEGFVIAGLTVGCGAALALVVTAPKLPLWAPLKHIFVLIGLAAFLVCGLEVAEAYAFKTQWYSIHETLPRELWSWINGSLKKSSSLPKRILRISEIWMSDFKDWNSFGKKVGAILADYWAWTSP